MSWQGLSSAYADPAAPPAPRLNVANEVDLTGYLMPAGDSLNADAPAGPSIYQALPGGGGGGGPDPRGPGADDCAGATVAADGANAFDTTAATPDSPLHSNIECGNGIADDLNNNVWFSYVASCTGTLTVTACEQLGGGADFDTRIAVYRGDCLTLEYVSCNDDDIGNACGGAVGGFKSTVRFHAIAGESFLISVGGFSEADIGTGTLFIDCDPDTCGEDVYVNDFGGIAAAGFVTIQNLGQVGNGVTLGGTNRAVCRVQAWVKNVTAPVASPWNLRLNIWDACPSSQSPPVTACGSTANLLYTSLMDAPGSSVLAADPYQLVSWTVPNLAVPNTVYVTFESSDANTRVLIDDTIATYGVRASAASLCYTGNSGCGWQFGPNVLNFAFFIQARPILAAGACCDVANGTCTQVAGGQPDCDGPTEVFTALSLGGDCNNVNFPCDTLLGACCNTTLGTCADNQVPTACGAGDQRFSLGRTCANTDCLPECQPGGDGQPTNYGAHNGFLGRTADLSPTFAGFLVADNFSPENAGTLTSVRWWGVYRNFLAGNVPCTPQSGDVPDSFRITIWSDALDIPFQIVTNGGPHQTNGLEVKVDTGYDLLVGTGPRRVFEYTFSGLNVPLEADLCYWVEIVNNTTGGDCQWVWVAGPEGDAHAVQHVGDNVPPWDGVADVIPHDMAFCVDQDIKPDGCVNAIELPGGCCLAGAPFCNDDLGPSDCATAGGTFVGTGVLCPTNLCLGACCEDGVCTLQLENNCVVGGGEFYGVGSDCSPTPCVGACCAGDGSGACSDGISLNDCTNVQVGDFSGGALCADVTCANAFCDSAPVLACGESVTINNEAYTNNPTQQPQTVTQSCFGGGANVGPGAFWLRFIGTGDDVRVSLCNSEVVDTVLSVYTRADNNCALLVDADEVACSEDVPECGAAGLLSEVCVPATILGQIYWVLAGPFDVANGGVFVIDMACPCETQCGTCPADLDGNSLVNGLDVPGMVDALLNPDFDLCADTNGDGVDDLDDIGLFVGFLLDGGDCGENLRGIDCAVCAPATLYCIYTVNNVQGGGCGTLPANGGTICVACEEGFPGGDCPDLTGVTWKHFDANGNVVCTGTIAGFAAGGGVACTTCPANGFPVFAR